MYMCTHVHRMKEATLGCLITAQSDSQPDLQRFDLIVCISILIPRGIFLSLNIQGHHEGLETGSLDLVSRVNSWHSPHCLLSYALLGQYTVFQPVPSHLKPWGVVAARPLTTLLASILGHLAPGLAWMATAVRITVTCAFISGLRWTNSTCCPLLEGGRLLVPSCSAPELSHRNYII